MTARLVRDLVLAALIAALLILGPHSCTALRRARADTRAAVAQADAAIGAGAAAMNTVAAAGAADAATDTIVEETKDAIARDPRGGDAAAVDGLCRLQLYRDTPRCTQLRGAGAADAAGPGTGREAP